MARQKATVTSNDDTLALLLGRLIKLVHKTENAADGTFEGVEYQLDITLTNGKREVWNCRVERCGEGPVQ